MHRVNEHPRADRVGVIHDRRDVVHRAHRVRGVADSDKLGSGIQLGSQVFQVKRAIFGVESRLANPEPAFPERHPRRVIRVVVQAGDDDFVTGLEFVSERPAQPEGQRGHVRTEHDFARLASQQVGSRPMGLVDHRVAFATRAERAVEVCV